MKFSRVWFMPNRNTFDIPPIRAFVLEYLEKSVVSVDPFAGNSHLARYTNDLNPSTSASHHMDAEEFLKYLKGSGVAADLVLFDPPYSPRQISETYKSIGLVAVERDTQTAALYSRARKAVETIVRPGAVVLSFGWNSTGMGKTWTTEEIMLVAHGGAHNDTICVAQRLEKK